MRRVLILGAVLATFALLQTGCMSSSVKLHDELGANAAKGYAEFYLGVSSAKQTVSNPEFHVLVAHASPEGSQPLGKVTALCRHGPARLRVACSPGTSEFIITPTYKDGPDLARFSEWVEASPKRVSVNIAQGMVTPVRIMVDVSDETWGTESLKSPVSSSGPGWRRTDYGREVFNYLYALTTATGKPQPYYDLAATKYECKGGMVFVEGRSQSEVDDMKKRLLSAASGLNLWEPSDNLEFRNRFLGSTRDNTAPQGVMTRVLLFGKGWSGLKVLVLD